MATTAVAAATTTATGEAVAALNFASPVLVCENCSWPDSYATLRRAGNRSVLIGSAHGVGDLISKDGGKTWGRPPAAIQYPCGQHCIEAPDGRIHGFGTGDMPPFTAPDRPQRGFSFPQSWWATVSGNADISTVLEHTPETFELDFEVSCQNKSHWGGWPSQCPFWAASSGGSLALKDGQSLLTVVVPFLGGNEGATAQNTGIYAFVSNDTLQWRQRSRVATVAMFPDSGEGPSENSVARLSNGSILVVFRVDAGDGQLWIKPPCPSSSPRHPACLYANYHRSVSTDEGRTWGKPQEISNAGAAFPRLLSLGAFPYHR